MGWLLWRIAWWALRTTLMTLYAPPWLRIGLKILSWVGRLGRWAPVLGWLARIFFAPVRFVRWLTF